MTHHDALEIVASYENPTEAQIAQGRLQSEGILAMLHDANFVSLNWALSGALGGVKLVVRKEDADAARRILAEPESADSDDAGWGQCPTCGGRRLAPVLDKRAAYLTWLCFGIPLLFPRRRFLCRECGVLTRHPR